MSQALRKRLEAIEARLIPKEQMVSVVLLVSPNHEEVTGIVCNGEVLHRLPDETREGLHERAFAHFKPPNGGVALAGEVF